MSTKETFTPRTSALVAELQKLKSNTLQYPCEVQLRQLCETIEDEHHALYAALKGMIEALNSKQGLCANDPIAVQAQTALLKAEKGGV